MHKKYEENVKIKKICGAVSVFALLLGLGVQVGAELTRSSSYPVLANGSRMVGNVQRSYASDDNMLQSSGCGQNCGLIGSPYSDEEIITADTTRLIPSAEEDENSADTTRSMGIADDEINITY
jgi:hypothetical protein